MSAASPKKSWHGVTTSAIVWLVVAGALTWAGFQLQKIDRIDFTLSSQKDKLEEIDKQVKSMRLVFRDYMLEDKPDKKALIRRLVAQQPTPLYVGMENFIDGKCNAAFNEWFPAAQRGDQESRAVAETALFKLYRGASGPELVKHRIAAGTLIELFKAPAYDPNDPKVLKFKMMLDEVGSSKPPASLQSPTPFKGGAMKAPTPNIAP